MRVAQVAITTEFAVGSFLVSAKCPLHNGSTVSVTASHNLCCCAIREDHPIERALVKPACARLWHCSL